MAYTYDDFLSAANKEGLMKQFTDSDLQIAQKNPEFGFSMLSVMKDAENATTAEQKMLATEVGNQLRKAYQSVGQSTTDGSFQYDNETEYQKALNAVTSQEKFEYDHEEDPTYSAYKKAMIREGERASANALAQASAASGGRPSSYALTAAQQAGSYYASKIGDIIPTLQQNAYQQYLNDFDKKLSALSALSADRSDAYTEWINAENTRKAEIEAQAEAEQLAEQIKQSQEQQKFENALTVYKELGYATPEIAEMLGLQVTEHPDENTGESDLPIDYASILALGYENINAEMLNNLIRRGFVEEYVENGVYKYRRVSKKVQGGATGLRMNDPESRLTTK